MIRALLSGVAQEETRAKPKAESRSMLEVICCLYDEEQEDFHEHLGFPLSTSLKAGLDRQNQELHGIDPQGWVVERQYNEQDFAEIQEKFFAERKKSLDWLMGLSNPDWEAIHTSEYGSMRAGDMFACWVTQDNLHIR